MPFVRLRLFARKLRSRFLTCNPCFFPPPPFGSRTSPGTCAHLSAASVAQREKMDASRPTIFREGKTWSFPCSSSESACHFCGDFKDRSVHRTVTLRLRGQSYRIATETESMDELTAAHGKSRKSAEFASHGRGCRRGTELA